MGSRFFLCSILASSLAWHFPFSSAAAQQITSETLELRGRVINSATGEPVALALVQVSAPGPKTQFTGADGTFVFTGLPPGNYWPLARKPGFFDDSEPQRPDPAPLLSSGQHEPIILKLLPEAILFGEVKDENGAPLEGVTVRAQQWQELDGEKQFVPAGSAFTDDEGNFRLAELKPGRYYLSFLSTNGGWTITYQLTSEKPEEQGYGAQFYPGVPDLESASAIEIRAGAQVHIVQTLSRQRLFQVAGVVRGADPASGFNLTLTNSMGDMVQKRVRLDPNTGQFQISGVPRGTYLLEARANQRPALTNTSSGLLRVDDEDRPPLTATVPLRLEGDVSGLVVVLGSGISVDVQVLDEISDNGGPNGLHQVSLQMKPQGFPRSASRITVPRAPDERRAPARFEGLAPGVYSVSGTSHGPWYIASMRCGSVDLLRDDLTLTTAAAPPIQVVLRGDGAQLALNAVKNGQPATAGLLLFSPDYPRRSRFLGRASSVSVGNLAPGRYYVIAMRGAENLEFRNPTAMDRYLTHATEVILAPRATLTISAEVAQPGEEEQ
jgi:Carboxypeptidase regulatory-like domain